MFIIKLKSKKNNSNETLNFNNLTPSKKNNKNSSSFKDLKLETNFSSNEQQQQQTQKIKSSTLPLDHNTKHLNQNSVTYSIDSNNTTLSSYGSIINTNQDDIDNFATRNSRNKSIVISDNSSSHLADQLECNMSTNSVNLNKSSSALPSSSNSTTSNSNSTSYLDENNLKLAIIDYSDILKLIKLQNSIEYHEWLAFNSKFQNISNLKLNYLVINVFFKLKLKCILIK